MVRMRFPIGTVAYREGKRKSLEARSNSEKKKTEENGNSEHEHQRQGKEKEIHGPARISFPFGGGMSCK